MNAKITFCALLSMIAINGSEESYSEINTKLCAQNSAIPYIGAACSKDRCPVLLDICCSGAFCRSGTTRQELVNYIARKQLIFDGRPLAQAESLAGVSKFRPVLDYMAARNVHFFYEANKGTCLHAACKLFCGQDFFNEQTKYIDAEQFGLLCSLGCAIFGWPAVLVNLDRIGGCCRSIPFESGAALLLPGLACCLTAPFVCKELTTQACIRAHCGVELCCMEIEEDAQRSKRN